MFYYLLARNVNINKNIEQVASISVMKYIALFIFVKVIEHMYLEPGFLFPFVIALMVFDCLFSLLHHYQLSNDENKVFWDDDIIQSDFSLDDYKKEFNKFRDEYGKRSAKYETISKPFDLGNDFKMDIEIPNNSESDDLNTDDLEGAIHKILIDSNIKMKNENVNANANLTDTTEQSKHDKNTECSNNINALPEQNSTKIDI